MTEIDVASPLRTAVARRVPRRPPEDVAATSDGRIPASLSSAPKWGRNGLLGLALVILASASQADTVTGEVIGITDGDTLTLLVTSNTQKAQMTIRLNAIDAPERGQAFGTQARQALGALCFRKQAQAEVTAIDRYGRSVAAVRCGDIDANEEMVARGMAWVYRKYAPENSYANLYAAEQRARTGRLGLWSDPSPVYPADWRAAKR